MQILEETEEVQEIFQLSSEPISLDMSIGADTDKTDASQIVDLIPENRLSFCTEPLSDVILQEEVEEVLSVLNQRERKIIRLRFGLEDGAEWALAKIGAKFNLTRERIRQIETEAIKRLMSKFDVKVEKQTKRRHAKGFRKSRKNFLTKNLTKK